MELQLEGIDYSYVLEVNLASDFLRDAEADLVTKLDHANRIIQYALYDA
jgi:hypothetical protein